MAAKRNLQMKDIKPVKASAKDIKPQEFGAFMPASDHIRLDEHIDETIYIVKVEQIKSDTFGPGYRLHWRDFPNAKETYTSSVFGQYVVPQLDNLWTGTNDGQAITETKPVRTTIRQAGRTYRFE